VIVEEPKAFEQTNRDRRVGFFFDSRSLQRDWSFELGTQAVSGTDGMILEISRRLSQCDGFDVQILATALPTPDDSSVVKVENLAEAVKIADERVFDFLVFVATSDSEQLNLLRETTTNVKLIAWAQCTPSFDWMSAAWYSPSFYRLVTVSNIQRNGLAHHPLYSRMCTIHNCVDTTFWNDHLGLVKDPSTVVFVGALKPSKSFHKLAEVWSSVRNRIPAAKLIVCGSPGLYGQHDRLGPNGIAELNYEPACLKPLGGSLESAKQIGVSFVGSLNKQDLRRTIAESSAVIVNPDVRGVSETFCVSAAEAMSMGLPVIGGDVGGLMEVVRNGEGGILVRNSTELVNAIVSFLQDPVRAKSVGGKGRELVNRLFNAEQVTARWKQLFSSPNVLLDYHKDDDFKPNDYFVRCLIRLCFPMSAIVYLRMIVRKLKAQI
jgi:glycosyltransferase involved in cell wall biosynthesis